MGNDWWLYIDRLETMAFFAGYPFVYVIVHVISGSVKRSRITFLNKMTYFLPYVYALVGTLYVGLILKNLYPDYSIKNVSAYFDHSYLKIWGILAVSFWIPALNKKNVLSLLHSLVFFFFLLRDLFLNFFQSADKNVVRNDMKIYTDSLLLNAGALSAIILVYFLVSKMRSKK